MAGQNRNDTDVEIPMLKAAWLTKVIRRNYIAHVAWRS
jgi:hypothetical protein